MLPILGITMGDPAGIGPEIIVKALDNKEIYNQCRPVVVGDAATIKRAVGILGRNIGIHAIEKIEEAAFSYGVIDVYDLKNVKTEQLIPGQVSAMAGNAAFEAVRKVIQLALAGDVHATVTAPINKESINLAGHHYAGHTEIYAQFTQTKTYAMLLVEEALRVIHVSTHVPLRKACDLVKKERILDVTQLLHDACVQFGIPDPKIGIAGLNPHASDGGLFGDEDEKEIVPAVQEAIRRGIRAEGPVPPDTLFAKAAQGFYDGCVAMYHDQGHIPFKLKGFIWDNKAQKMESVKGVNITLGLPIIRTSVDHGTAFEIAGKGIASEDAMLLSIEYAIRMAKNKMK